MPLCFAEGELWSAAESVVLLALTLLAVVSLFLVAGRDSGEKRGKLRVGRPSPGRKK
jgi:hypothetical protein